MNPPQVARYAPRWAGLARLQRYNLAAAGAVVVVFVLFALIEQLIVVPPTHARPGDKITVQNVHVFDTPTPPDPAAIKLPLMPTRQLAGALPQPPAAPAPSAVPELPPLQAPPPAAPALNLATTGVRAEIGASANLFGSGTFAGFAGSGNGSGGAHNGGKGYGHAADFTGKTLVPLSTARPEITKWAYQHHIEGWVTVAFTVKPDGHVSHLRIINAYPKGVFEAAAVKSISNWIYPEQRHPVEVKQRVEFKLKDYQYNWTTD